MNVRLRIDLGYDGSSFHGYARQPDVPTVQGSLEGALSRLCGLVHGRPPDPRVPLVDERVASTCAGRTDAGVHAVAQVVHLDLDPSWSTAATRAVDLAGTDPEDLARRLHELVDDAITVWSVAAVDDSFDARFSARERRYRYVLTDAPSVDPRGRAFRWDVGAGRDGARLDVDAMHVAAQHLVGEHDYASLCRRSGGRHTVRRIDEITVARAGGTGTPRAPSGGDEVHVAVRGPAFCHQQVRSLTGCLVEVGLGERPPAWMGEVLAARDRSVAARVAPARGLTLEGVSYADPWPDAGPAPAT